MRNRRFWASGRQSPLHAMTHYQAIYIYWRTYVGTYCTYACVWVCSFPFPLGSRCALGRKGPITSNRSAECSWAEGPNALLSMQLIKSRRCSATAQQRGRMHTHYSCARYARHSDHKLCANSPANGRRTRRPLERSAGDLICCHRSEMRDQLAQIPTHTHTQSHRRLDSINHTSRRPQWVGASLLMS